MERININRVKQEKVEVKLLKVVLNKVSLRWKGIRKTRDRFTDMP